MVILTVRDLEVELSLKNWTPKAELETIITGGYAGDMLSWVMGRAKTGCVWVTIMSNTNVAAVALMADVACVVLAENVEPDEILLVQAQAKNIPLFTTSLSSYEFSCRLNDLLSNNG